MRLKSREQRFVVECAQLARAASQISTSFLDRYVSALSEWGPGSATDVWGRCLWVRGEFTALVLAARPMRAPRTALSRHAVSLISLAYKYRFNTVRDRRESGMVPVEISDMSGKGLDPFRPRPQPPLIPSPPDCPGGIIIEAAAPGGPVEAGSKRPRAAEEPSTDPAAEPVAEQGPEQQGDAKRAKAASPPIEAVGPLGPGVGAGAAGPEAADGDGDGPSDDDLPTAQGFMAEGTPPVDYIGTPLPV